MTSSAPGIGLTQLDAHNNKSPAAGSRFKHLSAVKLRPALLSLTLAFIAATKMATATPRFLIVRFKREDNKLPVVCVSFTKLFEESHKDLTTRLIDDGCSVGAKRESDHDDDLQGFQSEFKLHIGVRVAVRGVVWGCARRVAVAADALTGKRCLLHHATSREHWRRVPNKHAQSIVFCFRVNSGVT